MVMLNNNQTSYKYQLFKNYRGEDRFSVRVPEAGGRLHVDGGPAVLLGDLRLGPGVVRPVVLAVDGGLVGGVLGVDLAPVVGIGAPHVLAGHTCREKKIVTLYVVYLSYGLE